MKINIYRYIYQCKYIANKKDMPKEKFYYLKYGKPLNKNVAAASKEKKQQIAPQNEKEYKSYAGSVKRPQQTASNQSRPMSFVDQIT